MLLRPPQGDSEALILSRRSSLVSLVCSDTRLQQVKVTAPSRLPPSVIIGSTTPVIPVEGGVQAEGGAETDGIDGAFEFTVASAPLHGVSVTEVNALVMKAVNAEGKGAFLLGVRGPGTISCTASGQQRADK